MHTETFQAICSAAAYDMAAGVPGATVKALAAYTRRNHSKRIEKAEGIDMDNTRHKARRTETTTPEADATSRVCRALKSLAHAEAELHETGRVDSDILDWTMSDIRNAMRRCQLYMREANQ